MSLHTNDMEMDRPNIKYRSKICMTKEFFKGYFGIPDNIDIVTMEYNATREILNVVLSSGELVSGYIFEVGEGMEIPNISPTNWMEEASRRRFHNINNNAEAAQLLRGEEE